MNITDKSLNNFLIVSLHGILNASSAPQLLSHITGVPEDQSVVIDLEKIEFLDSSGLGVLVGISRKKRAAGATFRLAGMNNRVRKVFELTNTSSLFDIYDDAATAATA